MNPACCPGPGDAVTWPKQSTCGIDPRVDIDDEPDFTFDRIHKLLGRARELIGEES